MKKRNLKSLKLNKKTISSLSSKSLKGGFTLFGLCTGGDCENPDSEEQCHTNDQQCRDLSLAHNMSCETCHWLCSIV